MRMSLLWHYQIGNSWIIFVQSDLFLVAYHTKRHHQPLFFRKTIMTMGMPNVQVDPGMRALSKEAPQSLPKNSSKNLSFKWYNQHLQQYLLPALLSLVEVLKYIATSSLLCFFFLWQAVGIVMSDLTWKVGELYENKRFFGTRVYV